MIDGLHVVNIVEIANDHAGISYIRRSIKERSASLKGRPKTSLLSSSSACPIVKS